MGQRRQKEYRQAPSGTDKIVVGGLIEGLNGRMVG
jgi:hypothetical protein